MEYIVQESEILFYEKLELWNVQYFHPSPKSLGHIHVSSERTQILAGQFGSRWRTIGHCVHGYHQSPDPGFKPT